MTKRKRVRPGKHAKKVRDRSGDDDSLLLRSAESLGRVIGALQRQLDGATKRLSDTAGGALDKLPSVREIQDAVTPSRGSKKGGSKKKTAKPRTSAARKGSAKGAKGSVKKTT